MKRMKRWMGIMLSVILAVGSLQSPVLAADTTVMDAIEIAQDEETVEAEVSYENEDADTGFSGEDASEEETAQVIEEEPVQEEEPEEPYFEDEIVSYEDETGTIDESAYEQDDTSGTAMTSEPASDNEKKTEEFPDSMGIVDTVEPDETDVIEEEIAPDEESYTYGDPMNAAEPIPTGSQIIADGNYYIVSALDNSKGLDVYGNNSADGTNVDLYTNAEDSTQVFTVKYLSDGSYAIIHKSSGKYLDVAGAALEDGANVNIWTSNNTPAQRWVIKASGATHYFNIISKCNGRYLDVADGIASDLANIQVNANNGSDAQKWKFIPAEDLVSPGTQCVPDGTYHIVSALNNSKGIDVYNNESSDGTNVELNANTTDDKQVFTVKYLGNGFYSLIHRSSGKCLDVSEAGLQYGTNVMIWSSNNSKAQQWVIKESGDDQYYNIISRCNGLCLDVDGGRTTNLTNIQVFGSNGTNAQKWMFVPKLSWKLTGTGNNLTLTISGTGEMDNYSSSENAPWAYAKDKIKTVVIEEGITKIGDYSFYCCKNLTSVTIPDSVTSIGRDAFHGCSSLKSITLPDGVTGIGQGAFIDCSSLKSISLPDGVTAIGASTFSGCSSLTSITIPSGQTRIYDGTFKNCSSLTSIKIPSKVTVIGNQAFYGCSGLKSVTMPDSVTQIDAEAFANCTSLTSIKLPTHYNGEHTSWNNGLGEKAFWNCSSLTSITFSEKTTYITKGVFGQCSNLTSVTIPEGVTSIEEYAFYECNNLYGVLIPESVIDIGESAFSTPKKIYVISGSYAEQYVKEHNINHTVICKTHQWNTKYTVDKAATCIEEGSESIHCSVCGAVKEGSARAVKKTDHSYGSWQTVKAATCTKKGSRKKTCSVCGDVVTEAISAKGHTWSKDYIIDKTPTYTEEGSQSIHCTVCDVVKEGSEVSIPKLTKRLSKTVRGDMFNLANNVKVTWKEVAGAKYYKVYREGITDPSESLDEPVIVTERLIGWDSQPGLTNGHAYRYKIVASYTGKGDSSGDSPVSYSKVMYRLKTVVIRSVKNTAPGKVTVKYDKTTSGDSYVLQYCERQDMVGAKTKVVLGANNTSYVIGGLKKGKTYYISIRVRKKVNGIDYYTTFGVAKKVKITQ